MLIKINNSDLNGIRGISAYIWDESAFGSRLLIEDNGRVVQALNNCYVHQNARAKIALNIKGIFEWDVIVEKSCGSGDSFYIGVCVSDCVEDKSDYWVLDSAICFNYTF